MRIDNFYLFCVILNLITSLLFFISFTFPAVCIFNALLALCYFYAMFDVKEKSL